MLVTCPRCIVRNLPHAEQCAFCATPLQPPEQAERHRQQWEALSPGLRGDLEEAHRRSLGSRRNWADTLRGKRTLHAVLGALLFGAPMSFLYTCWWGGGFLWLALVSAAAFAAGGAAGSLLNARGGGQWRGALLFEGAFLVSFATTVGVGFVDFPTSGEIAHFTVRALLLGGLSAFCLGFGFGRYLDFDRHQMD